jgi:hypothetical protein
VLVPGKPYFIDRGFGSYCIAYYRGINTKTGKYMFVYEKSYIFQEEVFWYFETHTLGDVYEKRQYNMTIMLAAPKGFRYYEKRELITERRRVFYSLKPKL